MRVKTITRSAETCSRERKGDIFVVKRNADAALHPFERAREYVRAVNAAKLDRIFAKPFVAALAPAHIDGVYCMAKNPTHLTTLASGSADGEVRLWDLSSRKCLWQRKAAHEAFVRGLAFLPDTDLLLSCGDDKTVRLWDCRHDQRSADPLRVFQAKGALTAVDSHRHGQLFATSGAEHVAIWDRERSEPVQVHAWGADTVGCVRFNQAEPGLLASCATDRSLMLHDMRTQKTISRIVLRMRANAVCWNPQEAVYLTAASDDGSLYTFDMRYTDRAVNVLQGHVSAVIDLDYSPTGQEIATAGYDRSLRIFNTRQGHSRDIYHNRRMQRLFCVRFSMDSKYLLSGSDDGNVRLWKAQAAEQLGPKNHRQQDALNYSAALLTRFKQLPEVRRIANHRIIPKDIKSRALTEHVHRLSQKRKLDNVIKHSKPGSVSKPDLRKDAIVQVTK